MSNRAKKSGIGLQTEMKMEANYDREEAAGTQDAIVTWLNQYMPDNPIPGSSLQLLHRHLQDGTFLCKVINKLLEADGKSLIKFKSKAVASFVARENIQTFNEGCEKFGMGTESLFQSDDLYEGRKAQMYNVVNNLHVLGSKANEKGLMPAYLGQIIKTVDDD